MISSLPVILARTRLDVIISVSLYTYYSKKIGMSFKNSMYYPRKLRPLFTVEISENAFLTVK